MRNRLGNICMALGITLVLAALSLFTFNMYQAHKADEASKEVLPKLMEQIPNEIPADYNPYDMNMKEVKIGNYYYIGYISFPYAGVKLPVMSDWDYNKLDIAPCRYYGTTKGHNLVIAGHNFTRHFGVLARTSVGDRITFTEMEGVTTAYNVAAIDVLSPTAIEEMTNGEYDLTLFTCTYGGKSRITVRCDQVYSEDN